MSAVPFIPDTAPFTAEQRAWLNGFFAGIFSRAPSDVSNLKSQISSSAAELQPLTILFGSQTGTAESLAKKAAKLAGQRGFAATVLDMAQTNLAQLAAHKNILVIVSTYGEGEPPDNAKALHVELSTAAAVGAPSATLGATRFSVCSLGDTNYTQFCQCGKDFDALLEKLGAARATTRVDCDLDYDSPFATWLDTALAALGPGTTPNAALPHLKSQISNPPISHLPSSISDSPSPISDAPAYGRSHPFPAVLLTSRNLNAPGSAKQVHHVEFSLADSGLTYEAGDALGVFPQNCPELVTEILTALGCDGEEAVSAPDGSTTSLRRALTELYDLGKPSADLLKHYQLSAAGSAPSSPAASAAPHHVLDVLLSAPDRRLPPGDFIRLLRKLQPRLYSISSSPSAHTGQVHLTVGAVRYEFANRPRKGVCSTFLADRVTPGESRVGVFVHSNKAFRPPSDATAPMIMVGPGTGIAPFRAFLAERRAAGATGKNWLFFGDQRASTDFLYRDELLAWQSDGLLTRLDLAWSRDQTEKIYVQTRMLEHAAELYAWLETGAHFYVCGDASRMAKDVDAALHEVVQRAGGKTADQAAAYVQSLRTTKRYARDVY